MKTKEELNALKEEVENLSKKLAELSEDEMEEVTGGKVIRREIPVGPGDQRLFKFSVNAVETVK